MVQLPAGVISPAVGGAGAVQRARGFVAGGDLLAREPGRAVGSFEQALGKVPDIGDRVGEAYVLCGLGAAKTRLGELGEARAPLQRRQIPAADAEEAGRGPVAAPWLCVIKFLGPGR